MGLKDRLEKEAEKTSEDVDWALNRNPEAANKAMKFMRSSIAVKLAVILVVVGSVYYIVISLSMLQLAAVFYLLVGAGTARYSDYGYRDWEAYLAVGFWLPIVVYSFLPDKVRIEK
jgi:hypothetical protein